MAEQLRDYASRGVFREFSAMAKGTSVVDFRFVWLTSKPIHARFDARYSTMTVIDLLPGIPPRSAMDRALRTFVADRFSAALPTHRRLSKQLLRDVRCVNRNQSVSLSLKLSASQPEKGVRQLVQLISEIFQNFLMGPYHEYLIVNFDLREE